MAFDLALRASDSGQSRRWLLVAACLVLTLAGCNRESAELTALREDNERLKKALEQARNSSSEPREEKDTPNADLDLPIAELWSQRFEDNQFRSKQRLDQKQIRVTGMVESVFERSVTIFGTGTRFGSVSLLAQLDEAYVVQNSEGLASLQKGAQITVQGRFVADKMWLQDAAIVDRQTGKRLVSKDLVNLAGPPAEPASPRDAKEPSTESPETKSAKE